MRRGRPKSPLTLTAEEIETLERWVRCPTTAQALAQRARIVLACTSGDDDTVVAAHAPVTRQAIGPVAPAINDARTGGEQRWWCAWQESNLRPSDCSRAVNAVTQNRAHGS